MAKKAAKKKRPPDKTRPRGRGRAGKHVYFFGNGKADGNRNMKDLLGGKGSGLAEMTNAGLPVPPGFTISTDVCTIYYKEKAAHPRRRSTPRSPRTSQKLEKAAGATLGSTENPLLVSVRSGAKFSMPGMMDTILNLGLNDQAVEGLKAPHPERPLRVRQLSPLHADVRQRRARDSQERVRARVRRRQGVARREAGHRAGRTGAARRRRALQGRRQEAHGQGVPAGSDGAAEDGARRRVPLLDEPARAGIPPHLRHPGLHRHGRQRADDGVRQHRRSVGHGRRLHAQPRDRQEGVLRRIPDQRAGRGRRRRHPHAAADPRARAGDADGLQAAAPDHHAAREALQGRPGLRVHDPGRAALHAADAQRQAHRVRGRRDRDRSRGRAARSRRRKRSCWSIPSR